MWYLKITFVFVFSALEFDNDDNMNSSADNDEEEQSTAMIVKNDSTSSIGDTAGKQVFIISALFL